MWHNTGKALASRRYPGLQKLGNEVLVIKSTPTKQWASHFLQRLREDPISAYAAQAVFFILLSFIPFLLFLLTLLKYLSITQTQLLFYLQAFLPEAAESLLLTVLTEVQNQAAGKTLSVTAVFTLWSASRGILGLMRGLNAVYEVPENRGYLHQRLIAVLYTFGFVLLTAASLAFLVFGGQVADSLETCFQLPQAAFYLAGGFRLLIASLVFLAFFLALFFILPARRSHLRAELPGALITTAGWLVFSAVFSFYVQKSSGFSVYGSLTGLVILMLWAYFCMYILFVGAEINVMLQKFPLKK